MTFALYFRLCSVFYVYSFTHCHTAWSSKYNTSITHAVAHQCLGNQRTVGCWKRVFNSQLWNIIIVEVICAYLCITVVIYKKIWRLIAG